MGDHVKLTDVMKKHWRKLEESSGRGFVRDMIRLALTVLCLRLTLY